VAGDPGQPRRGSGVRLSSLVTTSWAGVVWAACGWFTLADGFQRSNAQRQDLVGLLLLLLGATVALVGLARDPRPRSFVLAALALLPLAGLAVLILFFL